MAYEDQKVTYRHRADQLDAVAKPLRNLVWVGALALAAWVQFLGPGLAYAVRELSGSNEISAQMDVGFGVTNDRLDFIEQNIKPPVVVNWNFNRQLGECTHGECRVLHNLSRTEYGENCGVPRASAKIRDGVSGQIFELPFGTTFEEREATRTSQNFIVPLLVPDVVLAGVHQYQITNLYPDCSWIREPIPRQSPWFHLEVAR
tara:strand:- start:2210 stop:2818 length:609 start_codon:yes stop_codon:yes gene_type:complete